jgi:hypothetical protein
MLWSHGSSAGTDSEWLQAEGKQKERHGWPDSQFIFMMQNEGKQSDWFQLLLVFAIPLVANLKLIGCGPDLSINLLNFVCCPILHILSTSEIGKSPWEPARYAFFTPASLQIATVATTCSRGEDGLQSIREKAFCISNPALSSAANNNMIIKTLATHQTRNQVSLNMPECAVDDDP